MSTTPKRRGRPATGKDPIRTIRVSDQDWQTITEAAEKAGVPRSEFIRDAVLSRARRLLGSKKAWSASQEQKPQP